MKTKHTNSSQYSRVIAHQKYSGKYVHAPDGETLCCDNKPSSFKSPSGIERFLQKYGADWKNSKYFYDNERRLK